MAFMSVMFYNGFFFLENALDCVIEKCYGVVPPLWQFKKHAGGGEQWA